MAIDTSIFKTYDIRGVYPSQVNEEAAYRIGRAFVSFLRCKNVVVGMDMRLSSPSLKKELIRGLTDQGADVYDIGLCTTPMLNFSIANYNHDAGIMISASHNPSEYNAFKLIRKPVMQIGSGNGMEEIRDLVVKNDFKALKSKGSVEDKRPLADYVTHVMKSCKGIKGIKIVCDYGNGIGSLSALELFKNLDINVINMYEKPDGRFPNHPANPHDVVNMDEIRKRVIKEKADMGVFFDGDADRSIIIDDKGEIVFTDILLALLAKPELERKPKENVYFDLRFSKIVEDEVRRLGGKPVMMKVGNPFYKEKLINEGGVLAGEFSGHIMFKDNFYMDDGLFAAVKIMSILCSSGKKLSELTKPLKVYSNTPEINIKISSTEKGDLILKAVEKEFKGKEALHLDGVSLGSMESDGWWFNLRKSNTEPLVRLRAEAKTSKKLEEIKDRVIKTIESVK